MKAISFLGTTDYKLTTYVYRDRCYKTEFFAESLPHFFPDLETILVFVTPTVQQHPNLAELQKRLGERVQPVPIPEGHSEGDLWAIFDVLTSAVSDGDVVLFDITNSLRSLPFLVFLASAFLRTARQVQVTGVLYGAYEGDRSPVFDLSPFLTLLDWLTATDQFIHTGDARRLADLLKPARGAGAAAAQTLSEVSLAAFLCQPFALMGRVGELERNLQQAEGQLASSLRLQARPFGVLRGRIMDAFGAFAADFDADPLAGLRAQWRLIEWYYANNQLIQAMTLAREWLISAVTYRLGQPIDMALEARRVIERALSGIARVGQMETAEVTGEKYEFSVSDLNEYGRRIWAEWPERDELKRLWNLLTAVRNALDHAGHQKGPMALKKIVKNAKTEVMPQLRALAERWGMDGQEGNR